MSASGTGPEAIRERSRGGEAQRAALARALAPGPRVLLLDEPFSNLDRRTRDRVRDDTLAVLRASGATTLLVTHDPEEALGFADRIALMRRGRIVQVGTARDIIRNPASDYVADFVAHMDPLVVLTAADLVEPGEAEGPPLPATMPVREVMAALSRAEALPVAGGGRVTRAGVLARLAGPRG